MTEPRGIVVVGASAGGVEALRAFCGGLPADLPGAVCVVVHIPRDGGTALPNILNRSGPLPAAHAGDGAALEAGRVYVAPPNRHLLIRDGQLRLSHGPVENGHRPAADPLFGSARVRGFQPTAGRYSEAAGKTIRQLIERLGDLSGGIPEDVLQ
ncbi:chemotaxis protein CheB [Dactylosporangium matsuzakiense]|uniref:protein-glutamate methylesterase n=1 Tax=Dactylosporangium matsuzakiense TaxID=53360 RepID=A0A9W6KRA4_9ACTN|nr:chemotaxis protein CheB [Dactylosporangium matsuzakiense]UWZ49194.1 chemotaxis protein CheB [Dactylosporangium matsuzakiense]GLL06736.1 hypothetical protein GCM10017581_084860 [Dactylosporangium matsuzakiense]